jgi:hypothetical protein
VSLQATPNLRSAQCDGKQGFDTFARAEKVARNLKGARAYRCPHCHQYHIGSTMKRTLGPPLGRRPAVPVDGFED